MTSMRLLALCSTVLASGVCFPTVARAQATPGAVSLSCTSPITEGQSSNCTVGVAGGQVTLSGDSGLGITSPALTVPDFSSSFSITTVDDKVVTGDVTKNINASYNGLTSTTSITVKENDKSCWDGSIIDISATCPPQKPIDCPEGGQVIPPAQCPGYVNGYLPSPTIHGNQDIPTTDHDVTQDIYPRQVPPTMAPDVVGAFRIICAYNKNLNDDPVTNPGQPGKSPHTHTFTGNYLVDANSTYLSLRISGGDKCNDVAGFDYQNKPAPPPGSAIYNHAAYRSVYWMPALLDGKGNIILPDQHVVYYKRWPASSVDCQPGVHATNGCLDMILPNGVRYITGANVNTPATPYRIPHGKTTSPEKPVFLCYNAANGSSVTQFDNLTDAAKCAQAHLFPNPSTGYPTGTIEMRLGAGNCWDARYLDVPDHRSHVAFMDHFSSGPDKCPADHPYIIATFTDGETFSIAATDDANALKLASDDVDPTKKRGWSLHVDYFEAIAPEIKQIILDNCINKLLSGSGGNLCNGTGLKGAMQPYYIVNGIYRSLWQNPVRLVPAPPMPGGM